MRVLARTFSPVPSIQTYVTMTASRGCSRARYLDKTGALDERLENPMMEVVRMVAEEQRNSECTVEHNNEVDAKMDELVDDDDLTSVNDSGTKDVELF